MTIFLIAVLSTIAGIAIPFVFKDPMYLIKVCFIVGIIAIVFSFFAVYFLPFGLTSNSGRDLIDVLLLATPSFKARLFGFGYFTLLAALISYLVFSVKRVFLFKKHN